MKPFSEEKKKSLRQYLANKKLSKREIEVVILVVQGLINREVANKLYVAEKTVKFHLTNVYKKLNISRRSQLVWTLPQIDFIGQPEPPAVQRSEMLQHASSAAKPLADEGMIRKEAMEEPKIPSGISTVDEEEAAAGPDPRAASDEV